MGLYETFICSLLSVLLITPLLFFPTLLFLASFHCLSDLLSRLSCPFAFPRLLFLCVPFFSFLVSFSRFSFLLLVSHLFSSFSFPVCSSFSFLIHFLSFPISFSLLVSGFFSSSLVSRLFSFPDHFSRFSQAPKNGSTSSFFSIRSCPGGIL